MRTFSETFVFQWFGYIPEIIFVTYRRAVIQEPDLYSRHGERPDLANYTVDNYISVRTLRIHYTIPRRLTHFFPAGLQRSVYTAAPILDRRYYGIEQNRWAYNLLLLGTPTWHSLLKMVRGLTVK